MIFCMGELAALAVIRPPTSLSAPGNSRQGSAKESADAAVVSCANGRKRKETSQMKTILVPVDFSDVTDRVLSTSENLARTFGARLILLHVSEPEPDFIGFEPGPMAVRSVVARDFRKEHQRLDQLKATVAKDELDVLALHIQGPLVDKIVDEAAKHHADLIVMGSHGHGALFEFLVGSVTSGVLRAASCPVMVIPADKTGGKPTKE
jgi:nucleotide-binding universal stress UspA family protein